jgi:GxxExxY protein
VSRQAPDNRIWLRTDRQPQRLCSLIDVSGGAPTGQDHRVAIEVHRTVGPGLLESVYAECVALEPGHVGIRFEAQVTAPVIYKGVTTPPGFRADVVVENTIILEIKAVAALL